MFDIPTVDVSQHWVRKVWHVCPVDFFFWLMFKTEFMPVQKNISYTGFKQFLA